jgi:threonylcarbamoyladenosine tRNA methylthiotransferase MtaB
VPALREAGAAEAGRFFAGQIGRIVSLLTEAEQSGHSEHFAPVHLAQPLASGVLLRARITGATNDTLLAEAA